MATSTAIITATSNPRNRPIRSNNRLGSLVTRDLKIVKGPAKTSQTTKVNVATSKSIARKRTSSKTMIKAVTSKYQTPKRPALRRVRVSPRKEIPVAVLHHWLKDRRVTKSMLRNILNVNMNVGDRGEYDLKAKAMAELAKRRRKPTYAPVMGVSPTKRNLQVAPHKIAVKPEAQRGSEVAASIKSDANQSN